MTGNRRTAERLVAEVLALAGPGAELASATEREWASVTFSGARHRIELALPASDPDAPLPPALARIGDHEFDLGGEIVADCAVTIGARAPGTPAMRSVRVDLLTIVAD